MRRDDCTTVALAPEVDRGREVTTVSGGDADDLTREKRDDTANEEEAATVAERFLFLLLRLLLVVFEPSWSTFFPAC